MRLLTFLKDGSPRPGLLVGTDRVLDFGDDQEADALGLEDRSVLGLISAGEPAWAALAQRALQAGALLKLADLQLAAPIPRPRKNVICVGRNYLDHIREGALALGQDLHIPDHPPFFTKAPTSVIGPGAEVRFQREVTGEVDYEVELGVVIGKAGRNISREEALEHVFGYTIVNDVSARDLQFRHGQWFKGKSLDTFCPIGPWIVTQDEVGALDDLELTLSVNGEERQRARVGQMIFPVDRLIASLSEGMTLEPGDIIATGTPAGVGFSMTPPRYLRDGDVVRCSISRIGALVNRVSED